MKADKALIEAVAIAIEKTRFGSRFNDWTRDHVPGLPIEIFKIVDDTDEIIVARYPAHVGEAEALRQYERTQQAIAALRAAGFEIDSEYIGRVKCGNLSKFRNLAAWMAGRRRTGNAATSSPSTQSTRR